MYEHNGISISFHGVYSIRIQENNIQNNPDDPVLHAIDIQINNAHITCFNRNNEVMKITEKKTVNNRVKNLELKTPKEDENVTT